MERPGPGPGPGPGLTALPVEVIQHISRYLSVQDVLSCSATCHSLRAALNDNYVWRKYLPQEDISGLATREQQVSPRLEMGESLTPLCEKRQHFARKTHLITNWREGNYVRYSNESEFEIDDEMFIDKPGQRNIIYKDNYIFLLPINCEEKLGIEIWDITKNPIFHTILEIDKLIKCDANDTYFDVGSHLTIAACDLVFVYQIKLPDKDFPLMFSFLITDNEVTFNEKVHHNSHSYDCQETDHWVVNNYLMSTQPESNRLHVWDINNASKIGSFELPMYADQCLLRSFFGNVCMIELMSYSESHLVTFNLDKKQLSHNKLTYNDNVECVVCSDYHFIVIENSIEPNPAGLYDIVCTRYDCETFLELSQRRITDCTYNTRTFISSSQCFVDGTFIITFRNRCHVVNALTLEIVNTVNYCNSSYVPYFNYLNVYENLIVAAVTQTLAAVGGEEQDRNVSNNVTIQLWHASRKDAMVLDLNVGLHFIHVLNGVLFIDSLCTKLILTNGRNITVIHLW